jgi:hypothetical protein
MSPLATGTDGIDPAPILRSDSLDLLYDFDRRSEAQYVTTVLACDFPML